MPWYRRWSDGSRPQRWVDELRQDLRAGRRSLVRYPVVAIVAVLSLGAGIAATAAALTIRDVLFQNPPPLYAEPGQLSKIQVAPPDRPIYPIGSYVPASLFMEWRNGMGRAIAAADAREGAGDVRIGDRTEPTRIRPVTGELFALLGVGPEIGRGFSPGGVANGPEAILSYRLWQEWFGGRPDAVGATVWINSQPHTVIGVMPRRFWFSELNDPVWTRLDPERLAPDARLHVVVRRPGGTSHDALAASLQRSLADYSRQLPAGQGPLRMRVSAIKGTPFADSMALILPVILGSAVALTLLIACANAAILMIAQWTRREAETAVRSALGASRLRLVRALLAESLLLASAAGVLGLGGTYVVRAIMLRNAPLADTFVDLSIHPGVLIKTIAITLFAGVLAGVGPALIETRRLQIDPLRGMATSDRVRQRWSHALVTLEITVTLALLVVTSSMVASYQRARYADLGFTLDRFMAVSVQSAGRLPTMELAETIARVPGVEAVAPATAVTLIGAGRRLPVGAAASGAATVSAEQLSIGPEFFATLGVPMRAGRTFGRRETPQTRAVVVSESLARQLFGTASPLGRQVWIEKVSHDVVGMVADYATNPMLTRFVTPKIYLPLAAAEPENARMRFLIRAAGDPATLVEPVRRELRDAVAGVNVTSALTLRQMATVQGQEYLVGTAPLFPLIVIGMLLMSSGIYGVLAFAVSRRSRELAIRIAIGAERGDQIRLVAAHSLRLVLMGSAGGIGLTFALSRFVRAVGAAGTMLDPPWQAFVLPVVLVAVVALLATWIPTRRALRVNPVLLLKAM